MPSEVLLTTDLSYPAFRRGKVRDVYDLGDSLLIVATDRISAFDCVMPNGIPEKGRVLAQTSNFWFDTLPEAKPNHVMSREALMDALNKAGHPEWADRSVLGVKTDPLPIECVVRGYISGSLWKEYLAACREAGPGNAVVVHGYTLPAGLKESDRLPEPIFTPATKESSGHDINISYDRAAEIVGAKIADEARGRSIALYNAAAAYALRRGIIIADTKFEFGIRNGQVILIDEILTPDSSRFWPADAYEPGHGQPSFDKQFVRDYLETLDWDKTPPAPQLPAEVVEKTAAKYREAFELITGAAK
ncbi:MAG TPA: phosphoribosylaminoimidazolesuccinocarboxamide synthase [Armatimonadota bacterium]|jgi:phosphoribosylaminoimidazole-succinocarboxamide synthase